MSEIIITPFDQYYDELLDYLCDLINHSSERGILNSLGIRYVEQSFFIKEESWTMLLLILEPKRPW